MKISGAIVSLLLATVGLVVPPAMAARSTAISCGYAGSALTSVSAPTPRAAMEPYWRKPHAGRLAAAQWVDLVVALQASTGGAWKTVASKHAFTLVKKKAKPLKGVGTFKPAGGTSYRILQTVRWIKPTGRTADHTKTVIVPGTCAATTAAGPAAPSTPPTTPPPSPPVTTARWAPVPPSNPTPSGTSMIHAVSCVGVSWCMAVGAYAPSGALYATVLYAEIWDGEHWHPAPAPVADNGIGASLACASTDYCLAVAGIAQKASTWNGTTWSSAPAPPILTDAVSCVSKTFCASAGSGNANGEIYPAVATWNGSGWSETDFTALAISATTTLLDISCASTTTCLAVGYADQMGGSHPLSALLSNGSWQTISTPEPGSSKLTGVSCTSDTACLGVGSGLTASWNGSAWTLLDTADSSSVSCASSGTSPWCETMALDGYARIWSGGASLSADPATVPDAGSVFDLSCPAPQRCLAVGDSADATSIVWAAVRTP